DRRTHRAARAFLGQPSQPDRRRARQGRCRMSAIVARNLSKKYGGKPALDEVSFSIEPGRIVGLIGPNGAGKTTALKAILGLTAFEGELSVLGQDPRVARDKLMNEVCFIADVAILPRWIRVS